MSHLDGLLSAVVSTLAAFGVGVQVWAESARTVAEKDLNRAVAKLSKEEADRERQRQTWFRRLIPTSKGRALKRALRVVDEALFAEEKHIIQESNLLAMSGVSGLTAAIGSAVCLWLKVFGVSIA